MQHPDQPKSLQIQSLFSLSWEIWKKYASLIIPITLVVYLPVNLILMNVPVQEGIQGVRIYLQIIRLLEFFIGTLASTAILLIIKDHFSGITSTFKSLSLQTLKKYLPIIGTGFLISIATLGLTLLLIVPGIIFSVYWTFWMQAVVMRDKGGYDAAKYSKEVVYKRWWTTAGISFIIGLFGVVVSIVPPLIVAQFGDSAILDFLSDTTIDILGSFFVVVNGIFFLTMENTKVIPPPEPIKESR